MVANAHIFVINISAGNGYVPHRKGPNYTFVLPPFLFKLLHSPRRCADGTIIPINAWIASI